ncbi:hypothetical protein [Actimicrobium antarcticum]|uniref:CdiI C-terminal domain-containing protein n=1 Tax=Actimicrobium antarcticum TaxID=1051899 RepID=A0ABP7SZJ7_9BURK
MTFNITAVDGVNYSDDLPRCEIEMNGYLENCPLMTDLWGLEDYRRQWRTALTFLYEGKVKKCMLVTDINKMHVNTALCYWALYANGDLIYIHDITVKNPGVELVIDPIKIESFILPRFDEDEDDD